MAIVPSDITFRYSGGAGNVDPALSLGGVRSTVAGALIDTGVANDLWDNVSSVEASAGDTEYRGFYVTNAHATLPYTDARIYISVPTTSADDEFAIAIADEAVDVAMETIANEGTAPVGPVFSAPATYAAGLVISTSLAAGSWRGVWIRRVVGAAAAAVTNNSGTIATGGDTT